MFADEIAVQVRARIATTGVDECRASLGARGRDEWTTLSGPLSG